MSSNSSSDNTANQSQQNHQLTDHGPTLVESLSSSQFQQSSYSSPIDTDNIRDTFQLTPFEQLTLIRILQSDTHFQLTQSCLKTRFNSELQLNPDISADIKRRIKSYQHKKAFNPYQPLAQFLYFNNSYVKTLHNEVKALIQDIWQPTTTQHCDPYHIALETEICFERAVLEFRSIVDSFSKLPLVQITKDHMQFTPFQLKLVFERLIRCNPSLQSMQFDPTLISNIISAVFYVNVGIFWSLCYQMLGLNIQLEQSLLPQHPTIINHILQYKTITFDTLSSLSQQDLISTFSSHAHPVTVWIKSINYHPQLLQHDIACSLLIPRIHKSRLLRAFFQLIYDFLSNSYRNAPEMADFFNNLWVQSTFEGSGNN